MGAPVIFSGTFAKLLASAGILFKNTVKLISGSANPSSSATDGPVGSAYLSTNGRMYVKQDAGSTTNWLPVDLAQAQIVTVAQSGGMYTSIQAAINAISDAAANKIYLIRIAPGVYIENITMKQFVVLFGVGSGPTAPTIVGKITASGFAANEFTALVHINQAYTIASDAEVVNDWSSPVLVNDFFLNVTNSNDYGFTCIKQDCSSFTIGQMPLYLGSIAVNSTYNGSTKDITAVEQMGTGAGLLFTNFTVSMSVLASSGTIIGHKNSVSGAAQFSGQNNIITISNQKAGSTATICGRRTTGVSTGFRLGAVETFRLLGYGTGIISCVNAAAGAEMFHAGCTAFVDSTMTGYVTNTALSDTQKVWLQSTNRDIGKTGAGLAIVTPYALVQTGFDSWSTVAGVYWSYVPATLTFTLSKRCTGMVKSAPVECNSGQSVVLTDYSVNYVYSDSTGTLRTTTSTNYGQLYRDNCVLFEVWVEGGRIITCNEAHPVEFPTAVSVWAHKGLGVWLQDASQTLAVNTALSGTLNLVGSNMILDHGIEQNVAAQTPVSWIVVGRRTSDGKAYMRGAAATSIPTYIDVSTAATVINAGSFVVGRSYEIKTVGNTDYTLIGAANNSIGTCFTATGVGAGTGTAYRLTDDAANNDWFVYRLGVAKSSLNSTDPQFFCTLHTAIFGSQTAARNAIAAGSIATFPQELKDLEIAQLGFGIIQGNGTGGFAGAGAVTPVTSLQVIGAQYVAGGTSTAASLITLLTTGFGGQLSGSESNVQAAFDRLDDYGFLGSYTAGQSYRIGNIVTQNGCVYRCTVAVGTATTWATDKASFVQVSIARYADLTAAESASANDGDLCYVTSLETFYRYVAAGGAITRDGTFVLNTGDGGNTRRIGVAGKYLYNALVLKNALAYQYGGTGLTALGTPLQVLRTNAGGTAIEWATAGGDVSGPASAVDNEIVRFDGTTGKLVQATGTTPPTLSDTGILNINNTTDATSATDGSLQTDGGLSVTLSAYLGSATNTPWSSGYHVTNRNIIAGTPSTSNDNDGGYRVVANTYHASGVPLRQTSIGGSGIGLFPRTSDTTNGIVFYGNKVAAANNTVATVNGGVTQEGQWSLGATTAGNVKHVAYGSFHAKFADGVYNIGGHSSTDSQTLAAAGGNDSLTITVDSGNVGYLLIVNSMGSGASAVLFVTYSSATIVEIADPSNIVSAGNFGVTKSANSYDVKVENLSAGALTVSVQAIGAKITAAVIGT